MTTNSQKMMIRATMIGNQGMARVTCGRNQRNKRCVTTMTRRDILQEIVPGKWTITGNTWSCKEAKESLNALLTTGSFDFKFPTAGTSEKCGCQLSGAAVSLISILS